MDRIVFLLLFVLIAIPASVQSGECDSWQTIHPEWIFCDDFEDTGSLVKQGRYFEYDDNNGDFINLSGAGLGGSHGMQVRFQQGEVGAGSLKLAFGRNPNAYMNKQRIRPVDDFREIYYRMYLKMEAGWQGDDPAKLSRVTCFTSANDWRQAMIAHLWSDGNAHLLIDPASCVDDADTVVCATYNDFDHLRWLGNQAGVTPIFSTDHADRWYCIEAHVKLNDAGALNGIQEFWIDGNLEAQKIGLDFIGSFAQYAINAVFFENYWNSGSVKLQDRYFDNIVVSTQPIGAAPTSVGNKSYIRPDRSALPVRMHRRGDGVLEVRAPLPISGICFYSSLGKLIGRSVVADRSFVLIRAPREISGITFYSIAFSDNTIPAYSGKMMR